MNPNTPPPSDDDLPDERDLAALYARLPKDEPGPALDAAVLARAARAVPLRRRSRWPVALASAAVLVLAAGVTWQLRDTRLDAPKSIPPAIAERMPATVPAPTPAATAAGIPMLAPGIQDGDDARRAEALPPAKPAARAAARKVTTERLAPQVLRSAPAPMPAPMAAVPAPPPAPMAPSAEGATAAFSEATPMSLAPHRQDLAPDDRVGEIRRLLDHGQRKEALLRLHELRLRYPHYELPQDLRDLEP